MENIEDTALEAKSKANKAWYNCSVELDNETLKVRFVGDTGDVEILKTEKEVKKHLRYASYPLQDNACHNVVIGDLVSAFHRGRYEDMYIDATVIQASTREVLPIFCPTY